MSRKELVVLRRRLRYRTELVALLVFVITASVLITAPRADRAQAETIDLSGVSLVFDIPAGCFNALCDDGSLSTGSKLGEDSAPIVICGQIPCPPGGEPGFFDVIRTNDSFAAWRPLEAMGIAELAALHAVPNDPARMKIWDRAEIKAMVLANLINIIDKPASQRTQADKVAYDRVARLVKAERLAIAQRAKQEYNAWASSFGCNWSQPPGFAAVTKSPNCFGAPPVAVDFHFSPTVEQFTEYATYYRYTDKLAPFGADALEASKDLAIALGALGGLIGAAAAGIAAWGIATAAGVAFTAFSFSAGFTATTAAAAAAVAAAPGVTAASIGGLVAIALAGAVLVVIASIQFAENLEVPGKLDKAIAEAGNDVDLGAFIGPPGARVDANLNLFNIIYAVETLPDTNKEIVKSFTKPTADHNSKDGTSDPKFKLQNGAVVDSFTSQTWEGKTQTTFVWNGWFANQVEGEGWKQALTIQFLDANGKKAHAGILGSGFSQGIDGQKDTFKPTDTLSFTQPGGAFGSATWWGNRPPTVLMSASSASGAYVAGQPVTFHSGAHDPDAKDTLNYIWWFQPEPNVPPTPKPAPTRKGDYGSGGAPHLCTVYLKSSVCPKDWILGTTDPITHTWNIPGTYHIGLIAYDPSKELADQWMTIVVVAAPPPPGVITPPPGVITPPPGVITPPPGVITPPPGVITPPPGGVTPPPGGITPPPGGVTPPPGGVTTPPGGVTPPPGGASGGLGAPGGSSGAGFTQAVAAATGIPGQSGLKDTSTNPPGGRNEPDQNAWLLLVATLLLAILGVWATDQRRRRRMER